MALLYNLYAQRDQFRIYEFASKYFITLTKIFQALNCVGLILPVVQCTYTRDENNYVFFTKMLQNFTIGSPWFAHNGKRENI